MRDAWLARLGCGSGRSDRSLAARLVSGEGKWSEPSKINRPAGGSDSDEDDERIRIGVSVCVVGHAGVRGAMPRTPTAAIPPIDHCDAFNHTKSKSERLRCLPASGSGHQSSRRSKVVTQQHPGQRLTNDEHALPSFNSLTETLEIDRSDRSIGVLLRRVHAMEACNAFRKKGGGLDILQGFLIAPQANCATSRNYLADGRTEAGPCSRDTQQQQQQVEEDEQGGAAPSHSYFLRSRR